jgi:hypothetical protein
VTIAPREALRNAVLPVGHHFLEVVAPIEQTPPPAGPHRQGAVSTRVIDRVLAVRARPAGSSSAARWIDTVTANTAVE